MISLICLAHFKIHILSTSARNWRDTVVRHVYLKDTIKKAKKTKFCLLSKSLIWKPNFWQKLRDLWNTAWNEIRCCAQCASSEGADWHFLLSSPQLHENPSLSEELFCIAIVTEQLAWYTLHTALVEVSFSSKMHQSFHAQCEVCVVLQCALKCFGDRIATTGGKKSGKLTGTLALIRSYYPVSALTPTNIVTAVPRWMNHIVFEFADSVSMGQTSGFSGKKSEISPLPPL